MFQNDNFLLAACLLSVLLVLAAYRFVLRDLGKMNDRDRNDFGNPG